MKKSEPLIALDESQVKYFSSLSSLEIYIYKSGFQYRGYLCFQAEPTTKVFEHDSHPF